MDYNGCSVIGYGSWATTLVGQLLAKGLSVDWLVTNQDVTEGIINNHSNPKYVTDLELDITRLRISDDIDTVVKAWDIILVACPSAYLQSCLAPLTVCLDDKFILSAIKGIVPDDYTTVLEYFHNAYGLSFKQMGVLSGPSHAEEVSRGKLSYMTLAGTSDETNAAIAAMFADRNLHIDLSCDIYGIEYAAILKNIYAIASGIATGLGYGDNFLSVLVATCAGEMERFLNLSYPFERDVHRRSYLGDLLVTCYSSYSRNRMLGQLIGKGCSVKSALNEMTMVAEGYYAANCIHIVNQRFGIDIPVADMVYQILFCGVSARKAMARLSDNLL